MRLSTVQVLCNLARVALELYRRDEICVPLEVSLSTQFTTLHFLMMCFNVDLSSWRLVLELFLREDDFHCRALLLRTFLGFRLRLVRLFLVSVFRSLLVLLVNFRLVRLSQSRCSLRFTRLVLLCMGAVLMLVTSVAIDTSFISAASDTSTNVLCLLDAAVRHLK